MEKVDLGQFNNNEIADLIVDNTLSIKAFLESMIFPKLNVESFSLESVNDLMKDSLGYLSSDSTMGQKLLQAIIRNQALIQSIAFLYIVDLCEKNPDKSIDEMREKFNDKVNSNFYDLLAKIMSAKRDFDKEPLQKEAI